MRVHLPRYYKDKIFDSKKKTEARLSDYAITVHKESMKLIKKHKEQGIDHDEWTKLHRQQLKESIIKNSKEKRKL